MANPRTLDEILAGASEYLYPAELGEKKFAINDRASDGDTALHVLAWQNDVDGMRVLIAAGAEINAVGDMGYTPLHVAVRERNVPMIALLLQHGARTDLKSEICDTAREEALKIGGAIADFLRNVGPSSRTEPR